MLDSSANTQLKIAILGTKGVPGRHGVEVVVDSLVPHLTSMGYNITVYGYSTYTVNTYNYHGAKNQGSRRQQPKKH